MRQRAQITDIKIKAESCILSLSGSKRRNLNKYCFSAGSRSSVGYSAILKDSIGYADVGSSSLPGSNILYTVQKNTWMTNIDQLFHFTRIMYSNPSEGTTYRQ